MSPFPPINPFGAVSIEWYHRWVEPGYETTSRCIPEYNEDDCIATTVLLEGLQKINKQ
ncbi:MAG TPA: hypothetical protein ENH52_08720 [Nitrospirae bacterium]|nr:hypothetical protein [Nitrospirota bacterium]